MPLLVELHQSDDARRRRALAKEAAEELERLEDGELLGELRLLQLDAEPLAQLGRVGLPPQPEHLDDAGVGRRQALADLDRRGLAGAVRSEQAETLAGVDLEVDAVDGDDVLIRLPEILDAQGGTGGDDWAILSVLRE